MALALVEEVVYLVAHLLAALAREEVVALYDARVVLLEAGGCRGLAERAEDPVAPDHVSRVEVAHAARGVE